MKFDISNTTAIIIVKLDSIDRLENLLISVEFLIQNFEIEIFVLECGSLNNGILKQLLDPKIKYSFIKDHDPILYRTKYLNQIIKTVETPFVAIWDTDVIIPANQIFKTVELLIKGEADFVYPYEKFLDTTPILRKIFYESKDIRLLEQNVEKMKEMFNNPCPLGGAFFASTAAYKDSGMENENFYGWGMEDGERYCRWINLGYNVKRIPGQLFHLTHSRGLNSNFHNTVQSFYKYKEVMSVKRQNSVSIK